MPEITNNRNSCNILNELKLNECTTHSFFSNKCDAREKPETTDDIQAKNAWEFPLDM